MSIFSQLQSAVAQVVEVGVPERFWIVEYHGEWFNKSGSHSQVKILAIGDRQVCQGEFERVVKTSSCCKLSRGVRTKGYAHGSVDSGSNGSSETFQVKEISRGEFLGMIFNPALSNLFTVVADTTATKE